MTPTSSETIPADAVVIGAGQAAPALAMAMAASNKKVVLIEAQHLGGTCVNNGCTPTKTLRKSARVAHMARRAAEFGVRCGPVEVDFPAAMQRMQERVDRSRAGLETWLASQPNVSLHMAWGQLAGRDDQGRFVVLAGSSKVHAAQVFLNTGTRPFAPPIPGLDSVSWLDNERLLVLRELPKHLVVIGGSYIGLEFAQIFRRLGSAVSVIETSPRIAVREDAEVSACIAEFLRSEGVHIHEGHQVERVSPGANGGVRVHTSGQTVEGSHLLVATGRQPNTERLGLETVGVTCDARGYVLTNDRLETDVPGIWALGDINKRGAFTHTSYHDHEIVLANLAGGNRSTDTRHMAYAMFTDPPLGRVGMSEAQARASGKAVLMAQFEMKNISRAKEESETTGLIKLLVERDSGCFLGATMVGINADEIIHLFAHAMAAGTPWHVLRDALPVHPTVSEFIPTILDRLRPLE